MIMHLCAMQLEHYCPFAPLSIIDQSNFQENEQILPPLSCLIECKLGFCNKDDLHFFTKKSVNNDFTSIDNNEMHYDCKKCKGEQYWFKIYLLELECKVDINEYG